MYNSCFPVPIENTVGMLCLLRHVYFAHEMSYFYVWFSYLFVLHCQLEDFSVFRCHKATNYIFVSYQIYNKYFHIYFDVDFFLIHISQQW